MNNSSRKLQVTGLAIYPVKSLTGIALTGMELGPLGPCGDRRYILVDEHNRYVTQRQYPRLCLLSAIPQGGRLLLQGPGLADLMLDPEAIDPRRTLVSIWGDDVAACDMGAAAAAWFSDFLQRPARLYFMPDDTQRQVDLRYARPGDRVGFADGFPILLTTQSSLEAINSELPQPIGMERFRPNIVVGGCAAFAEDSWRRIRIGAIEFDIVKPCSRCVIPSIDPRTAQMQKIVTQTLFRLRRRDGGIYFGQNLIHRAHGTIAVGDSVSVIE